MNIPFPEDEHTVFKQGWCPEAQETLIAFANGSGGVICFGVAEDGEVLGCDHDDVLRAVMSFARKDVEPTLLGLVRTRALRIGGRPVTVAHILPGAEVPYGLKGKVLDQGGVFIRLGGETVAATLDEVFELIRRGDRRSWETRPAAGQSLTFTSAATIMASFDQESLLGEDRLFTNLAALLSDQNQTAARLNFFRSEGTLEISETESGSVIRQMIRLRRRLDGINPPFIDSQAHPWPPAAPWEALACAMAHRDYDSGVDLAINVFQGQHLFPGAWRTSLQSHARRGAPPRVEFLPEPAASGTLREPRLDGEGRKRTRGHLSGLCGLRAEASRQTGRANLRDRASADRAEILCRFEGERCPGVAR